MLLQELIQQQRQLLGQLSMAAEESLRAKESIVTEVIDTVNPTF